MWAVAVVLVVVIAAVAAGVVVATGGWVDAAVVAVRAEGRRYVRVRSHTRCHTLVRHHHNGRSSHPHRASVVAG